MKLPCQSLEPVSSTLLAYLQREMHNSTEPRSSTWIPSWVWPNLSYTKAVNSAWESQMPTPVSVTSSATQHILWLTWLHQSIWEGMGCVLGGNAWPRSGKVVVSPAIQPRSSLHILYMEFLGVCVCARARVHVCVCTLYLFVCVCARVHKCIEIRCLGHVTLLFPFCCLKQLL